MKKVLSVLLAVTLLFAVCVPSFAAETEQIITEDSTDQSADVNVKTTFTTDDVSYTVTIPADIEIPWGDTAEKDACYSVDSSLLAGDTLDVEVTANDNGLMTATDTSITDTLTYTLTNGGSATFTGYNSGAKPADEPKVNIAAFTGTIAEYVGTLTYTVTYTAAPTD